MSKEWYQIRKYPHFTQVIFILWADAVKESIDMRKKKCFSGILSSQNRQHFNLTEFMSSALVKVK